MEIEKLTFLAVAFCQRESGDCKLYLAVIWEVGALPYTECKYGGPFGRPGSSCEKRG